MSPRPRALVGIALATLLGWTALAGGCGGGKVGGTGKNVVLISLDSTRRDLLSVYGRVPKHAPERSTCPNLERLASEGVVMEDAYSTTSWTLPSHMSMLTGLPELVHAVDVDFHRPSGEVRLLPQLLQEAGYRTAGFYTGPYLEPHFGFDRGFDRYEGGYGPQLTEASRKARVARTNFERAEESGDMALIQAAQTQLSQADRVVEGLSHRDRSSGSVTDLALEELARSAGGEEPFFLFVHYFDPHYDYAPPEDLADAFDPTWDDSVDISGFYVNPAISRWDKDTGRRIRTASERTMEHVQGMYEAELAWTDSQVGRILDRLDELGLTDDTLVIVTADHGDEFFEHGSIGHRSTLFEEQVRVPMILRLPGTLPEGQRVGGVVSTIDVVPTVLEALRLRRPELCAGTSFLAAATTGEEVEERPALGRFVSMQTAQVPLPDGRFLTNARAARVLETFRLGPIKIERTCTFPIEAKGMDADLYMEVSKIRQREQRKERLVWIDVEAQPQEPADAWSSDFGDARARAALRAFHDRYEELLRMRADSIVIEDDPALRAILVANGYAGSGDAVTSDKLALPPPGHTILGDG